MVKNLKKYYPSGTFFNRRMIRAVDDVSFKIDKKKVLVLLENLVLERPLLAYAL